MSPHTFPTPVNQLKNELSPYLLQHAGNPVAWQPWGDEAFAEAKRADKPVFLSIGYATCHWCHVMAHECFEDAEVAAALNDAFVCIKVDREERPDVDSVYMAACQMMNGHGGWPLTVVLTPERRPFFAATYIPKHSHGKRTGLLDITARIKYLWATDRDNIEQSGASIVDALNQRQGRTTGGMPDEALLHLGADHLMGRYDAQYGGFGTRPKFPTPHHLLFLLSHQQPALTEKVVDTLRAMAHGGIWDHVGYGFHRYSTDQQWLLPHFEKMLYDQATLLLAYAEAYLATGHEDLAQQARNIVDYLQRDMLMPSGAFACAQDADTDGVEGLTYVWTEDELDALLSAPDARFVKETFHTKAEGNIADESTGEKNGDNILHLKGPLSDDDRTRWEPIRKRLLAAREKRPQPLKDDKQLTDWNGLMIAALARAGVILGESGWIDMAAGAARFIRGNMQRDDGALFHRFRNGEVAIDGGLDDYAYLIWGLTELYQATFDAEWLNWALSLQAMQNRFFDDTAEGGYFMSIGQPGELPLRPKEIFDGAVPSGNSVSATNLMRLYHLTGSDTYRALAHSVARLYGDQLQQSPSAATYFLVALRWMTLKATEVVIAGDRQWPSTQKMLKGVQSIYRPNVVIHLRPPTDVGSLGEMVPYIREQHATGETATAYVCSNQTCQAPTQDVDQLLANL